MIPTDRIPTHPGEILSEEYLIPLEISQTKLAEHIGVSLQLVNTLINGKRGITPETAWKLAQAFKTSPEFWMNLQTQHDLAAKRPNDAIRSLLTDR